MPRNKNMSLLAKVLYGTGFLVGILAFVFLVLKMAVGYPIRNITESLPYKVFWISYSKSNLKIDDMVIFNKTIQGNKASETVIKIIKGVGGDRIDVIKGKVFVNRRCLGKIFPRQGNGNKLTPIDSMIIPQGMYFVWTPHPESFDSRYKEMNLIPEDFIEGRAYVVY